VPNFEIASRTFEISRAAVITDSNLFIEAFVPGSERYEWANYFLEESTDQWLVPVAVVVETWGYIVGSMGNWRAGLNFLGWLNTPGKDLLIIGHDGEVADEHQAIEELRIDCVDAMILTLATRIFNQCRLELLYESPRVTYVTS
jgi:hypothetical protein